MAALPLVLGWTTISLYLLSHLHHIYTPIWPHIPPPFNVVHRMHPFLSGLSSWHSFHCLISLYVLLLCLTLSLVKLVSCPPGTEATSLDIAKAYRNSPICPTHKKYLCVFWRGSIYVQHVAIEGLATMGWIQGNIADPTITILKYHMVGLTIKWVNNFIFFCCPIASTLSSLDPSFSFELSTIYEPPNHLVFLGTPYPRKAKISNPHSATLVFNGT